MSEQLWLRLPREVVMERGFGVTHVPGAVRDRLSGSDYAIDPLTGYACCQPILDMDPLLGWQFDKPTNWTTTAMWLARSGEYGDAEAHLAAGAFDAKTTTSPASGFVLGFIVYGNSLPLTLLFGTRYQIDLVGGRVTLGLAGGKAAAEAALWQPEAWEQSLHYLYVYAVGDRLCARRVGEVSRTARPDKRTEGGIATDPASRVHVEGVMMTVPGVGPGQPILPSAPVRLIGAGRLAIGLTEERHAEEMILRHATIGLPQPMTGEPTLTAEAVGADSAPTITLLGADGAEVEETPEEGTTGFGWEVTAKAAGETGPNAYLTRVRVVFPPRYADDGQTPVDLMALPPAGLHGAPGTIRVVEVRRAIDPASCGLTLELGTQVGQVAPYVQPHMMGKWVIDSATQQVFFTSRPSLSPLRTLETLRIDCETPWKLLQSARCGGDLQLAGLTLAEAYTLILRRAGWPEELIDAEGDYQLPAEVPDGEPQIDIRPDQTLAEALLYLQEQFHGRSRLWFDPDGTFRSAMLPTEPSGVVFYAGRDHLSGAAYTSNIQAVARGTSQMPTIRDGTWEEEFDEAGFANEVVVIGADRDGLPLVAVATDWPSIHGYVEDGEPVGFPFNYVGQFRRMVVVDGGLTSQGIVNWCARTMLARTRMLLLKARFESFWVDGLDAGDLVEIADRGIWRITGLTRQSDGPWRATCAYEIEQEVG